MPQKPSERKQTHVTTPVISKDKLQAIFDRSTSISIFTDIGDCLLLTPIHSKPLSKMSINHQLYFTHRLVARCVLNDYDDTKLTTNLCGVKHCIAPKHLTQVRTKQPKLPYNISAHRAERNALSLQSLKRLQAERKLDPIACLLCNAVVNPSKRWQKFCSDHCRLAHFRTSK